MPSSFLNDVQDSIIGLDYVRSQLADTLLGGLARVAESDVAPSTTHLWCVGNGAAPYPDAVSARRVRNLAGPLMVALGGTIDGVTPQVLTYHFVADELAVTLGDNTSGLDRYDLVQVKLARVATGAQRVQVTASVKVGTPGASPTIPAADTGFLPWCAVRVPNGIGSGVLLPANFADYRMPIGLHTCDVLGKDMAVMNAGPSTAWSFASLPYGSAASDGSASRNAFIYPTLGSLVASRITAVALAAEIQGGGASAKLVQINAMATGFASPVDLLDLSATISPNSPSMSFRAASVASQLPMWLDGSHAGYANRGATPMSTLPRLALHYQSNPGASDVLVLARFVVAG